MPAGNTFQWTALLVRYWQRRGLSCTAGYRAFEVIATDTAPTGAATMPAEQARRYLSELLSRALGAPRAQLCVPPGFPACQWQV